MRRSRPSAGGGAVESVPGVGTCKAHRTELPSSYVHSHERTGHTGNFARKKHPPPRTLQQDYT